ncbi:sulfite exporter TauE/SafE family protein [Aquabacterium soli]|uniref:sulfite exporter TauE/SafE family protein n=1 Tax=Aquabacterium soli TaxID=2493092 RepID=UPI001F198E27|nr:sulfite exporter TauE/SafE family protein [Aquabacterium soli]
MIIASMLPLSVMSIAHLLPALALGALLGFFGGLFGIGGGIIAIPLLVLAYGMDQPMAQGTALVMMVPNLLIGWWRYTRHEPVPWQRALALGLVATATTWAVAHLATRMPPHWLRQLFSLFLLSLSVHLLHQQRRARRAKIGATPPADPTHAVSNARLPQRYVPLVGLVGGSSMGLLGIGGGLVATPIFTGLFGQRQTMAQSFALALVAPSSVIALSTYATAHQVDWSMGLPLALAGMFTVSAGVALAQRLPEQRLRAAFAWMLLITSLWLLAGPTGR